MFPHLQEKHDAIMALHKAHRGSVLDLQATLCQEILPELAQELDLDNHCFQGASEYTNDYGSIFRMFKKHGFDIAETNAALERTLHWRISELAPIQDDNDNAIRVGRGFGSKESFIRCLPGSAHDVYGRPVLLIELSKLTDVSLATKREIVLAHEHMRFRLRVDRAQGLVEQDEPTLQCVMIVDFKNVAMRSMGVELIPWFIREVAPRFPGMCAAVFVMNYAWAFGMYNIVKRLLPTNVLARIHFPSESELLSCFQTECLPREYGGDLDISSDPEPLPAANFSVLARPSTPPLHKGNASDPPLQKIHLSHFLSSMSALNPYFGYPAISSPGSSVPILKNGRRRRRDLARTLGFLWLAKLKALADKTWLWIVMTLILWAFGFRKLR